LHSGNFPYFLDTQPDGSDLRFLASDDKTPLKLHIEQYDNLGGLAIIWVQMPTLLPNSTEGHVWMYYGNPKAPAGSDVPGTYDVATVAVYHYAETAGLPRDASAFANHPAEGSVKLNQPGVIDRAAAFEPTSSLRVPASPALASPEGKGFTVASWLKLTGSQDQGRILTHDTKSAGFHLEVVNNNLVLHLQSSGKASVMQTTVPLTVDRWYHVTVTLGEKPKLYIDGDLAAASDFSQPLELAGDLILGASAAGNGFTGLLDETQISNVERSAAWIKVLAKGQGPDAKLVVYGLDETEEASGGFTQLMLIETLAKAISVDGWVIIGITLLLGFIAFDVMVTRYVLVRRVEKLDERFAAEATSLTSRILQEKDAAKQQTLNSLGQTYQQSTLFRIFQTGMAELDRLLVLAANRGAGKTLVAEGLEVIRSGLDATIVGENNRLNDRMVWVTVAISGAPFLGLLGTVVGVMMTFATVAATGDVNVNTIAPGVASAMATTVVGLIIAIPCMFGYNYLATLISKRMSAMEVYADQLLSTFAVLHSSAYSAVEAPQCDAGPDQSLTMKSM
jgi:biopolymer transport protein ExbB